MLESYRRALLTVLLAALAAVGFVYRDTFGSIVQKWIDDTTFSHGFLIVPLALWLGWRKRHELAAVDWRPSWLGVLAVFAAAAAWIVARGSGVLVIEQFAVVAFIPAMVLAILGWPATRALIFPLAFIFFAVPFGRGIVPGLMQFTADLSTLALQWSGIPVLRSHMYISIPAGSFEVARACSGLNYVVTGLVLGTLYAHLTYRGWLKRLVCVGAFLVVPIVANGLRVYFTILVSHFTDMRFGPGTEHVTFGRIFFIAIMLVMFWIGRRWHDEAPTAPAAVGPSPRAASHTPALAWAPVPLVLLIILLAPSYLASSLTKMHARLGEAASLVALPPGQGGWQGPIADGTGWRPFYHGGLAEGQGVYQSGDGSSVDVFVAVYGLGTTMGAEMISYSNVLFAAEHGSLAVRTRRRVETPDGVAFDVREVLVPDAAGSRLVWHWFMVGDRPVTNEFAVKAHEALAFMTHAADVERIVTLATPAGHGASDRLQAFFLAHSECISAGFASEACGE